MKQPIHLKEQDLKNIVLEVVNEIKSKQKSSKNHLNEASVSNSLIHKWVYWCFNFHNPEEWMSIFQGAPTEHFMDKFKSCYQRYGAAGVMNAFYTELDNENQSALENYVMNNYNG